MGVEVTLVAALRPMWRHKLLSALVLLLMGVGVYRVITSTPSVYETRASYAFINPPPPPTAEDIARMPSLSDVNSENPFTRFSDQSVVVDIVVRRLLSEQVRERLVAAGADKRYIVAPSRRFGSSSPIAEVTGVGSTGRQAQNSAEIVGQALKSELYALQSIDGVDERYMIRPLLVEPPAEARLRISSRMRPLLAVCGGAALLLYALTSVVEAIDTNRAERAGRGGDVPEEAPASRRRRRRRDPVPPDPRDAPPADDDTDVDAAQVDEVRVDQHLPVPKPSVAPSVDEPSVAPVDGPSEPAGEVPTSGGSHDEQVRPNATEGGLWRRHARRGARIKARHFEGPGG